MKDKEGDKIRLLHIPDAIKEIESYLINVEFEDFSTNSMMRFACIKQMEIIGEACNRISPETQTRFSNIEWEQIIGMRNVFVHEYFGIDIYIAWEIIKKDIPDLKNKIEHVLSSI